MSGQHGIQVDADGPVGPARAPLRRRPGRRRPAARRRRAGGCGRGGRRAGPARSGRGAAGPAVRVRRPGQPVTTRTGRPRPVAGPCSWPGPGPPSARPRAGVIGAGRGQEHGPAVAVWAAALPGARVRTFRLSGAGVDDGRRGPGRFRRPDQAGCRRPGGRAAGRPLLVPGRRVPGPVQHRPARVPAGRRAGQRAGWTGAEPAVPRRRGARQRGGGRAARRRGGRPDRGQPGLPADRAADGRHPGRGQPAAGAGRGAGLPAAGGDRHRAAARRAGPGGARAAHRGGHRRVRRRARAG